MAWKRALRAVLPPRRLISRLVALLSLTRNHLGGGFPERETGAHRLAGHPAGTAPHHFLAQGERLVPAQLAGIEVFEARQQDRCLDRAGRRQGFVGLQLGVAAVVEHQQVATGLQILVACRQLGPLLAQGSELPLRFEPAEGHSLR